MLSWNVFYEDINNREISTYDIFSGGYYENLAKELKVKFKDKKEFADSFRQELKSKFWSRAEYEVVITSWPPYINVSDLDAVQKRVDAEEASWRARPNMTIVPLNCSRKIDIFDQLDLNWEQFINYVWNNI